MIPPTRSPVTRPAADEGFVRITTDDTELLLPALVQCGASFHLTAQKRLDIRGMDPADVASLAALYNARVIDFETVA